MTSPSLVIDNDIVIKLAQLDAYDDCVTAIGHSVNDVGSLGVMLRYMGRASEANRLRLTKSKEEADRLLAALLSISEVEPTAGERQLAFDLMKIVLQNDLDMDEGEVALLAVATMRTGTSVATGDKRALRSMPSLEARFNKLASMKGRLICFEQMMKALCSSHGLPRVRLAVLGARHADRTLTEAYDFFESKGASAFVRGMDMVIEDRISSHAPGWLKAV